MSKADRLSWTIARQVADMPRGTVFAASQCAIAGIRLSQELLGCELALCGRGGAYDPAGILSLHARHWLFNRRPRAHIDLVDVFDTLSEPHALLATPAQIDRFANANLSGIGDHGNPKVAFGGSRGLPDARTIHFVMPSHNARQLVERVDFVSTAASAREQPPMLITELCVMRWNAGTGMWRLEAMAAGIDPSDVRDKTGFQFEVTGRPAGLEEPGEEALALLGEIDPLGLRKLDFIGDRKEQLDAFDRIYRQEVTRVGEDRIPRREVTR